MKRPLRFYALSIEGHFDSFRSCGIEEWRSQDYRVAEGSVDRPTVSSASKFFHSRTRKNRPQAQSQVNQWRGFPQGGGSA